MVVGQLLLVLDLLGEAFDFGRLQLLDTIFVPFDLTLVILDHIMDVLDGLVGEFALKAGPTGDTKTLGLSNTMVHQDVDYFSSFLQLLLL